MANSNDRRRKLIYWERGASRSQTSAECASKNFRQNSILNSIKVFKRATHALASGMLAFTVKETMMTKIILVILLLSTQVFAQQWITVKSESRFNFSGVALVESNNNKVTLIVVHDNKDQLADKQTNPVRDKTERIGLVTIEGKENRPKYIPLKWLDKNGTENNLPVDLESITSLPEMPNHFMAGVGNPFGEDKKGRVYYVKLDAERKEVRVLSEIRLPVNPLESCGAKECDFESFAVQKFDNRLLAVWADRGRNEKASTLFWGELVLSEAKINLLGQSEIKTPSPDLGDWTNVSFAETRSISDLKVDSSGGLFVSSAFDSGDEGPFSSAFYYVGAFQNRNNLIGFNRSIAPVKLYQFKNYKIEAFEFVPGKSGGVIFGTDDELFGASISRQ